MVEKSKSGLTPEGMYAATLKSIAKKTSKKKAKDGQHHPLNITVTFALTGAAAEVSKEYPPKVEEGCLLLRDIKTVLGRTLTAEEEQNGVDDSVVIGKPCRVVVVHRAGSGGNVKATVGVVMAQDSVAAQ